MSYLPRMSKTYKEPQALPAEEPEDLSSGITLKPASSLLNEKTQNPQIVLKHYKYLPHAPPVLPGPSVLEEAQENELYREASRMRRSLGKSESLPKTSAPISVPKEVPKEEPSAVTIEDFGSKMEIPEKVKRTQSRKTIKGSRTSVGRKKSSKNVKRENTTTAINLCLVGSNVVKPFTAIPRKGKSQENLDFLIKEELQSLKREKSDIPIGFEELSEKNPKSTEETSNVAEEDEKEELDAVPKKFMTHSVQCTIFGSIKKLYTITSVINSLLCTQAFLFHELNKEETLGKIKPEKKSLLNQIQLLLGDLCNQKVDKEYSFDTTYSDFKRLEKLVGELQKYMKDNYGDKGEFVDKMEDLKRVFMELKKKEMQISVVKEKLYELQQKTATEVTLKESDVKNPEITLQNKRLEGEQLLAEVEFSNRELKNFQKTLAELDWDIRNAQDQVNSLKKSVASKSKTEVIGKKYSVHKFSSEMSPKGGKSKESESSSKRKT